MQSQNLRDVCFTLNNPTDEDLKSVHALPFAYLVYGREIGSDTGTKHLQGYFELKNRTRFTTVRKFLRNRAHLEKRRGTPQEAIDYCKKDADFYEEGTPRPNRQGTRSDLSVLYDAVKDGKTDLSIQEEETDHYIRHFKAVDRLRYNMLANDKTFRPLSVSVYWGPSGSGKTRRVYAEEPNIYRVVQSEGTLWWDGYTGQAAILFDDFYGWVKYGFLLQLLDGYPMQLAVKGGFTHKAWTRVYFTSNSDPGTWYQLGMPPALKRRINVIEEMKDEVVSSIT